MLTLPLPHRPATRAPAQQPPAPGRTTFEELRIFMFSAPTGRRYDHDDSKLAELLAEAGVQPHGWANTSRGRRTTLLAGMNRPGSCTDEFLGEFPLGQDPALRPRDGSAQPGRRRPGWQRPVADRRGTRRRRGRADERGCKRNCRQKINDAHDSHNITSEASSGRVVLRGVPRSTVSVAVLTAELHPDRQNLLAAATLGRRRQPDPRPRGAPGRPPSWAGCMAMACSTRRWSRLVDLAPASHSDDRDVRLTDGFRDVLRAMRDSAMKSLMTTMNAACILRGW